MVSFVAGDSDESDRAPVSEQAREISEAVPMPDLLSALGFHVNTRTRGRCACILHSGSNPSAFAWKDSGLWKCFSCGKSGDRIRLVRFVKNCSFIEALKFLADMSGRSLSPWKAPDPRARAEFRTKAMISARIAQFVKENLKAKRDELLRLGRASFNAHERIKALSTGELERFPSEYACAWEMLSIHAHSMRLLDSEYQILAHGDPETRFQIFSRPGLLTDLARVYLDQGGFKDGFGRFIELGNI